MTAKLNSSRYAHCEGHTGVCFSQDASYIITCGGEGDIRVWTGIEDDEATDKCVGEQAFAVCQRGEKLYVGTNQNIVQALTFPEPELDGVVTRFTAPVTHIDASHDGSIIVSASCDMTIGITYVNKSTTEILTGHKAPVLSVALDPKLQYLVSSSCDGTVKLWHLTNKRELFSWDCVPKSNSWQHATALGQSAWMPGSGSLLAIPFQKQVRIHNRDSWEKTITFSDPNPGKQIFSVVKLSACGEYIAASTTEGQIAIWYLRTQNLLAYLQTDEKHHICAMDWNPEMTQIAFCDTNGNFGTIDITPQGSLEKPEDVPIVDPVFGDTDDEDNENVISLEKIKNESGFLVDGLTDDEDKPNITEGDDGRSSRLSDSRPVNIKPAFDVQPPFQPSSSPISLQYRFMVWNNIGIVKQINTEEDNAIDVEFHDTSHHHAFRVNNIAGHTLAALSKDALVLACEATEDNPSKVVCVMLNAWDGSKEWTTILQDEEALCVAAGQGFVAVATDIRTLRVFTTCGTQREILSLPGPVVCMATHEQTLVVVFHTGPGLDGDQLLSYIQLWLGSNDLLVRPSAVRTLPVSPRAHLRWLGYTDEGSLCALDMAGMLRKLTPSTIWTPICDVDKQCKGKSDHHFVVGVNETYQTIRSVLCKGAFYPPTTPRPTVTEISWQIPLCETSVEKGELEEQFWRTHLALSALQTTDETIRDNAERTIKKTLLKLFALACQSGLEMRAVGLCQLMSPEVVQLAIKYASKLGRIQLADRISEAMSRQSISSPVRMYEESFQDPAEAKSIPLSQDMFAPSTEDQISGFENPILALKQKQPGLSTSGMLSSKLKRANPFKKSLEKTEETDKGLESLARQAVIKPLLNQLETPATKIITKEKKTKKTTFVDWFESQKVSLEEEFPELDSSELTKVALKRFKEDHKKNSNNNQRMKKFFGSNISNEENKNQNENSSTSTNEIPDSKKRKTCDGEVTENPTKTSAASKLRKFSFVKP